jgi:peptidoglycan/xylan/chitin deacetylase (PgdA/CDA1 family)
MMIKAILCASAILFLIACSSQKRSSETEIMKWQDGKKAAISLTFDDGTRNQFSVALPMLNELKMPATFYIITGEVEGSQFQGKFIGRPISDIIRGTADTPTNKDNFFERATAIGFSGYKGALSFHTNAGTLFEQEKLDEAYRLIDSGYRLIRTNKIQKVSGGKVDRHLNWNKVKEYVGQGHEFASHTVTHPRLAVLTEPNMLYELEKSKADIASNIGEEYTFSAECPYGTEDERVMSYAYKIYPSLRNRMPEKWLAELNRGSKEQPGSKTEEYVQWQRGAVTSTSLPLMKSWVDTVVKHNNQWLVLVFHGVDGIGWEALPGQMLKEYFEYIKSKESDAWVATFADVAKYMRERMNSDVKTNEQDGKISVELSHSLDKNMYDLPLTLKTYVNSEWKNVQVKQGEKVSSATTSSDDEGTFIIYQAKPNAGTIELTKS